jgi:hypothetical protein
MITPPDDDRARLDAELVAMGRAQGLAEAVAVVEALAAADQANADAYFAQHRIPGYMSTHRAAAGKDAVAALRKLR